MALVMGVIFFLDNYFSVLAAGVSNRKIADQNKMSREMYAFSINAVACATCGTGTYVPLGSFHERSDRRLTLGLGTGAGLGETDKISSVHVLRVGIADIRTVLSASG